MLKRTRHFFRYRHRRWMAGGAFTVVMGAFSLASVKLTSQAWFCKSCHLMESYHASWTTDAHNKIECVQCHIAPGVEHMVHAKLDGFAQMVNNMLGRASTRPSAHVSDYACTRSGCHVTADLGGNERAGRSYLFNHEAHLGLEYLGFKMHCTTCHSYVRGDVHFEINTNACITCHLMESTSARKLDIAPDLAEYKAARALGAGVNGAGRPAAPANWPAGGSRPSTTLDDGREVYASSDCRTCHNVPTEPINYGGLIVNHLEYMEYGASCTSCHQGVTAAPPPVEDSRCLSCHGFGMERKVEIDTTELHRIHAEANHKVQCFNCHGLVEHGPHVQAAMMKDAANLDCRACHANSHQMQRAAYMHELPGFAGSSGDSGLEEMPVSPMFLAHVACTSCHVEPDSMRSQPRNGTTVARATAAACDTCHRPGLGERTIPLWQRTTRELYQQVEDLFPAAARRAQAGGEAARLLHEAEQLLELVRLDGSWGVHNPRYTERLLHDARAKVLEARAMMNGMTPAPREEGRAAGRAGELGG